MYYPTTTTKTINTANLFSRAICCVLDTRCLGTARKVATSAVDTRDADPRLIHVSKKTLESKTLKDIATLLGDTRRSVAARCVPSGMFKSGVYLLPIELVPEVDDYLLAQSNRLATLVDRFVDEYDILKYQAQTSLGSLDNARDYPPVQDLRSTFGIAWQYLTVETPQTMGDVSREIIEREKAKAAKTWADAMDEATAILRLAFSDLTNHMIEKLTPGEDGKKVIFRDSMVGNLREFLRTFPARNLADDDALAVLAADAARLLSGVNAADLRDRTFTRDRVQAGMTEIKSRLDTLVMTAPQRRYAADDDAAAA